jgi:hypothetical protein
VWYFRDARDLVLPLSDIITLAETPRLCDTKYQIENSKLFSSYRERCECQMDSKLSMYTVQNGFGVPALMVYYEATPPSVT